MKMVRKAINIDIYIYIYLTRLLRCVGDPYVFSISVNLVWKNERFNVIEFDLVSLEVTVMAI